MQLKLVSLSLSHKIIIFFVFIVILSALGVRVILENVQKKELLLQAEAISKGVENLLSFTSDAKSIWIENSSNLKTIEKINLVQKSPNLIIHKIHDPEFTKLIANFFQESATISLIFSQQESRNWPSLTPKWSYSKNTLHYEKPILARKSCVDCHSKINTSSYLKEGEIAGTLKISLEGLNFEQNFAKVISPINIISFIIAIIALFGLIRYEIIKPLNFLAEKVQQMSLGNLDIDLNVNNLNEDKVKDEILTLAIAIERLRKSQKAMEKMIDDDSLKLE